MKFWPVLTFCWPLVGYVNSALPYVAEKEMSLLVQPAAFWDLVTCVRVGAMLSYLILA